MYDDAPRCTACGRYLLERELGHQGCGICRQRTDEHLQALAGPDGLYARLGDRLAPGSGSGGPAVSGSRTAPLPLRLEPLSLLARGGVVTILQTWLTDWHDVLRYNHPRWDGDLQQQCDQVVGRLRANLPWAAQHHPAFADFARETAQLRRRCDAQITGERPPRRVTVACPCGSTLHVTISTPGARCSGCDTQYGHAEVLQLPAVERNAA